MKKNVLLTLIGLLLIASLVLVACGGGATEEAAAPEAPAEETGGEEPAEEPAAPAEKAKVVIFIGMGTGTDPDQIAAQEALAEEFNANMTISKSNS